VPDNQLVAALMPVGLGDNTGASFNKQFFHASRLLAIFIAVFSETKCPNGCYQKTDNTRDYTHDYLKSIGGVVPFHVFDSKISLVKAHDSKNKQPWP